MIASILLVPTNLPRLLAPGVCGSRMPMMMAHPYTEGLWVDGDHASNPVAMGCPRGLVLAYHGSLVPEGIDRAKRVLTNTRAVGEWWWTDTPRRLRRWLDGDMGATYLLHYEAPVRVVLLGADDREVPESVARKAYNEVPHAPPG